ncbi:hypothetical protein CGGC5_v011871 [Colletotrichum fructicola Nara gc5]|uniref:Uncharacterized protein n=1 Tax=Colletotrichum fructicola (strain Nara gc5) TaxID=1213859 RepID=A0A7J6ISB0_COLFN|nr:hypothetical protein CGGC5_v011871 [Colletotrichum fructicola Nara gc5]
MPRSCLKARALLSNIPGTWALLAYKSQCGELTSYPLFFFTSLLIRYEHTVSLFHLILSKDIRTETFNLTRRRRASQDGHQRPGKTRFPASS